MSIAACYFSFSEDYKHTKRKEERDLSLIKDNILNSSVTLESNSSSNNNNSDKSAHRVHKRSTSYKRYVEVMVAADYHMQHYHGSGLHRYILTLMAIVSRMYFEVEVKRMHVTLSNFLMMPQIRCST